MGGTSLRALVLAAVVLTEAGAFFTQAPSPVAAGALRMAQRSGAAAQRAGVPAQPPRVSRWIADLQQKRRRCKDQHTTDARTKHGGSEETEYKGHIFCS